MPFRDIAEVIGRRLSMSVVGKAADEAANHFGWFANFAALDAAASSKWTQQQLGWKPKQIRLIADLEHGRYFETQAHRVST